MAFPSLRLLCTSCCFKLNLPSRNFHCGECIMPTWSKAATQKQFTTLLPYAHYKICRLTSLSMHILLKKSETERKEAINNKKFPLKITRESSRVYTRSDQQVSSSLTLMMRLIIGFCGGGRETFLFFFSYIQQAWMASWFSYFFYKLQLRKIYFYYDCVLQHV